MISILILTKNEEFDLPACLDSVSWSNDIHVYDSYSTDGTVEIAKAFGAIVTQRVFDDWSSHQNWGLRNIRFRHEWVFYIDADERMSATLRENLRQIVAESDPTVAYLIQRRDFLSGRWLAHVQATAFYLRFFRPERIRYERLVNPISIADGPVNTISGYLDHYPFSKGMHHWLERHNSYSTLEARQIAENSVDRRPISVRSALFATDLTDRKYSQKRLFYKLPFRPLIKFAYLYLFKRGFLDGGAGLQYALLQSIYEYMIVLKVKENSYRSRGK